MEHPAWASAWQVAGGSGRMVDGHGDHPSDAPIVHQRPFVCFVHIERAGGTTLNDWLQKSLRGYYDAHTWYYWSNEPEHILSSRELRCLARWTPGMNGIGGHTLRPWAGYERALGRPILWITFLRRPRDRFMSHFNYQRLVSHVPWSLEAFAAEPRFRNFQTMRLAGSEVLAPAVEQLDRFAFVGLTEEYGTSIQRLADLLGIARRPTILPPRNALAGRDGLVRYEELSSTQQRLVDGANELDAALYDHALTLFSRHQAHGATMTQMSAVRRSMDSASEAFRSRTYRFRQHVWAASIEAVVHRVAGGTKPPWAHEGFDG